MKELNIYKVSKFADVLKIKYIEDLHICIVNRTILGGSYYEYVKINKNYIKCYQQM